MTGSQDFERGEAPRHIKVTGHRPMFGYERCEDTDCVVTPLGLGSSCGRPACPTCGSGGTSLTKRSLDLAPATLEFQCSCGNFWISALEAAALRSPPGRESVLG